MHLVRIRPRVGIKRIRAMAVLVVSLLVFAGCTSESAEPESSQSTEATDLDWVELPDEDLAGIYRAVAARISGIGAYSELEKFFVADRLVADTKNLELTDRFARFSPKTRKAIEEALSRPVEFISNTNEALSVVSGSMTTPVDTALVLLRAPQEPRNDGYFAWKDADRCDSWPPNDSSPGSFVDVEYRVYEGPSAGHWQGSKLGVERTDAGWVVAGKHKMIPPPRSMSTSRLAGWETVDVYTAEDVAAIVEYLADGPARMLLPVLPGTFELGSSWVEVDGIDYVCEARRVELRVTSNEATSLSLTARDDARVCPEGDDSLTPVTVRGLQGCVREGDRERDLLWAEAGVGFIVDTQLPLDDVLAWLAEWETIR